MYNGLRLGEKPFPAMRSKHSVNNKNSSKSSKKPKSVKQNGKTVRTTANESAAVVVDASSVTLPNTPPHTPPPTPPHASQPVYDEDDLSNGLNTNVS